MAVLGFTFEAGGEGTGFSAVEDHLNCVYGCGR
jgi:hypothetical protein